MRLKCMIIRRNIIVTRARVGGMFVASLLLLGSLTASSIQAQNVRGEEGDWVWERDYVIDVESSTTVFIEKISGEVEIVSGPGPDIMISQKVEARGRSREEALEYGNRFELETQFSDGYLTISGRSRASDSEYEIRVPSGLSVSFESEGGELLLSDLDAYVNIRMDGGEMDIENIAGPLDIRSDGGAIEIDGVDSDVSISSAGGEMSIVGVSGKVAVTSGGGMIEIDGVEENVEVVSAGGSVEVSNVEGNVNINTTAGGIELDDIEGDAIISTGGGDIELQNVEGRVTATTSGGDIEGAGLSSELRLETLAGDIELEGISNSVRAVAEVGEVYIEVSDADFLSSGTITVEMGFGEIDILLPSDTKTNIVASVLQSGDIEIDRDGWSVRVLGRRGSTRESGDRRAEFEVGGGSSGEIELSLQSGYINIMNDDDH